MAISREAVAFALVLSLALVRLAAADSGHGAAETGRAAASCQMDSQPLKVTNAWAAFKSNPNELEPQLAIADALIDQGCYKDAVPILEAGLAQRPHSSELQSRLRAARSMLSEEHFFEGLGNAQETAKLQHSVMRCTKLADVSACDDALRSKPDDPQLVIAKGDAVAHGGRPADAILIYLRAGSLLPGDEGVRSKLALAESQRETLVAQCEGSADAAAADACQAALLRGSPDEFALLKRKGILLQSFGKPEQALDAFIAASVLKQDDKSVALAIVALTDSTGRRDALALAARGASLLTLHRAGDALQALRQAAALAPGLPKLKTLLAQAEQASRAETKRPVAVANTQPTTTPPAVTSKPQPGARVAASGAVTYSNDAAAAHTN
jgi:tetratricopeptide (TPR) repeat protein